MPRIDDKYVKVEPSDNYSDEGFDDDIGDNAVIP